MTSTLIPRMLGVMPCFQQHRAPGVACLLMVFKSFPWRGDAPCKVASHKKSWVSGQSNGVHPTVGQPLFTKQSLLHPSSVLDDELDWGRDQHHASELCDLFVRSQWDQELGNVWGMWMRPELPAQWWAWTGARSLRMAVSWWHWQSGGDKANWMHVKNTCG